MNYRHVYMLIISRAKSEEKLGLRRKGDGEYYEAHHILPRSLFPNWIKRKSNIVLLTAKEHYFVHKLLHKIYPGSEMAGAWFRLCTDKKHKVTMRDYEKSRIEYSKWCSKTRKGRSNNSFGKHWFSNGIVSVLATECPEGFYRGRGEINDNYFRKRQGRLYTDGKIEIRSFSRPKGFRQGSLKSFYKNSTYYECKETREVKRAFEWRRSIGISASMIKQCNDRGWAYKGKHFRLIEKDELTVPILLS